MPTSRTAVVYQSKYGSTGRYAKWIAEELGCPAYEKSKVDIPTLCKYGTIVYGGGLYAGGVGGIELLTKNYTRLRQKHLVLFTCGLADPGDADNVAHIRAALAKALPPALLQQLRLFHLRGGIDYARLGPVHKVMMAGLCRSLAKKPPESLREEDRQLLATYGKRVDFVDRGTIAPLVEYVRGLS